MAKKSDLMQASTLPRVCGAKLRGKDERCRKAPMAGGLRCRLHGGASPQAKRTARQRLDALREPAIVELGRILRSPDADDATKVRAAIAVLDRTGLGPSSHIEVDTLKPWQEALQRMASDSKRKAKKPKRKGARVIEGELTDAAQPRPALTARQALSATLGPVPAASAGDPPRRPTKRR